MANPSSNPAFVPGFDACSHVLSPPTVFLAPNMWSQGQLDVYNQLFGHPAPQIEPYLPVPPPPRAPQLEIAPAPAAASDTEIKIGRIGGKNPVPLTAEVVEQADKIKCDVCKEFYIGTCTDMLTDKGVSERQPSLSAAPSATITSLRILFDRLPFLFSSL